jgi:hypothetical protein
MLHKWSINLALRAEQFIILLFYLVSFMGEGETAMPLLHKQCY